MDHLEQMRARHSVRKFKGEALSADVVAALCEEIDACNRESGLHMQLVINEPEAFQAGKASYGQFKGCKNYLALVGAKDKDECIGYYGERVVLRAFALGVDSCWVALTYKKGKAHVQVGPDEKLYMVVALGMGENRGVPHKSKAIADVSDYTDGDPDWYRAGVEAALLAPTAMNQQKFSFVRSGETVRAKAGIGFYTKTDLGIAKYHFELGAGRGKDVWA